MGNNSISTAYTQKINKAYNNINCMAMELDNQYKTINYELIDLSAITVRSLFSMLSLLNNYHIRFINAPVNISDILKEYIKNGIIQLINGDDDYRLREYCQCYTYVFGYNKEIFNYLIFRFSSAKYISDIRELFNYVISHRNEFPKDAIVKLKIAIIDNHNLDDFFISNSNLMFFNKVDKFAIMKLIFNYNYSYYIADDVELNEVEFFSDLPKDYQLGVIL